MSRYNSIIENIGKKAIFCSNLGFGEQGSVLKNMPKSIFICPDIEYARNMQNQLNALNRENVIIDDFDNPFTISTYQSNEHKIDTIKTLYALANGNPIIISTAQILFNFIPKIETFSEHILNINSSNEYDIISLEKQLINNGYRKVDTLTSPGEFSRRGDILDIFNTIDTNPVRIDFFDTQIESIHYFDLISFEKLETIKNINIAPNKLIFLSDTEKENILNELNNLKTEHNIVFDLISKLELNADTPLEFLFPFTSKVISFSELNLPIIIANHLQFNNNYIKLHDLFYNKIKSVFTSEKLIKIYKKSQKIYKIDDFFKIRRGF